MSGERGETNGPLDIFGGHSARQEQLVARFEQAWQHGGTPRIEEYLAGQEDTQQLLQELVRVELECRLKADEAARVEEYLQRFPTLTEDNQFVLRLIRDERRLRARREPGLSDDQYLERFPQYRTQLAPDQKPERGADYHLLFGLLALQNDFVSREELVAATGVWLADKSRPLGRILLERKALAQDEFELLSALVDKHLQKHEDDVGNSLAALSSLGSVRLELLSLGDLDVEQSLVRVSVAREDGSYGARTAEPVGSSTSKGQRFRVLRPHASGGLGQVSVALDEELNREVALKEILRRHADQADSRARFVLEAEITGGLEHPGIVPVYGLGQYADGRPFYAMRFIKGDSLEVAIKRFHAEEQTGRDSGERTLEFRKLLGRFIDVCQAIEYAHSRGVLHRDLKPGNIMLGKYGETLVVDWGLAKPLGHRDSAALDEEQTLKPRSGSGSGSAPTQMGSAIGTPAFMSPEQAAGKLDELGPASDVYSLGATLYYLLTGQAPFKESDLGRLLKKVQMGKFCRPRAVRRNIPIALEAICVQAMALDYKERYSSPHDLAEDVEHWLADESVASYTEPLVVRVRRSARKHPKTVTALAATLLVGLVSAIIITAVVARKQQQVAAAYTELDRAYGLLATRNTELKEANRAERQAKNLAEDKCREAEQAREKARDEAEVSRRTADFVVSLFQTADPVGLEGIGYRRSDTEDIAKLTIREVFHRAAGRIAQELNDQPAVQATLMDTIGGVCRSLGFYEDAKLLLNRALEIRQNSSTGSAADLGKSFFSLALLERDLGDLDSARQFAQDALSIRLKQFGERDRQVADSKFLVAWVLAEKGDYKQAEQLFRDVLQIRTANLGKNHRDVSLTRFALIAVAFAQDRTPAKTLADLSLIAASFEPDNASNLIKGLWSYQSALSYRQKRDYANAQRLYDATLEIVQQVFGHDDGNLFVAMLYGDMAGTYRELGDMRTAEQYIRKALTIGRGLFGAHPLMVEPQRELAELMRAKGIHREAEELLRQIEPEATRFFGEESRERAAIVDTLARVFSDQGRFAEAESRYRDVLKLHRKLQQQPSPSVFYTTWDLANVLYVHGNYEEANQLFRESLALKRTSFPGPDVVLFLQPYATFLRDLGDYVEAESVQTEISNSIDASLSQLKPEQFGSQYILADVLIREERYERAEEIARAILSDLRAKRPDGHPDVAVAVHRLAYILAKRNRLDETVPLLHEALSMRKDKLGVEHPAVTNTQMQLALVLQAKGDEQTALELAGDAVGIRRKYVGDSHVLVAPSLDALAMIHCDQDDYLQADHLLNEAYRLRRTNLKDAHPAVADSLIKLAELRIDAKQFSAAEKLLREGNEFLRAVLPSTSWRIALVDARLGECLAKQQPTALKQVEPFLLNSYQVLTSALGSMDSRTQRTIRQIVEFYEASGMTQEADRFRSLISDADSTKSVCLPKW